MNIFILIAIAAMLFLWFYNMKIENHNKETSFNLMREYLAANKTDFNTDISLCALIEISQNILNKYPNHSYLCFHSYLLGLSYKKNEIEIERLSWALKMAENNQRF